MTRLALSLILRDLLEFRGYKLCFVEGVDETLHVTLSMKRKTGFCPVCGKRTKHIEGTYNRWVRDLDVWNYRCYIRFQEKKIQCKCGYRGVEKLDFTDRYSRCTNRFEEYVFRLCRIMTLLDVSELLGLSWHTVKNIDKKYINKQIMGLACANPTRIGVDEVAYTKGMTTPRL